MLLFSHEKLKVPRVLPSLWDDVFNIFHFNIRKGYLSSMNSLLIKKKEQTFRYSILGLSLLFYLFFSLYDGVYIAVDSPTYLEMSFSREPFYPLFLALFRCISPTYYLMLVITVQGLLMGFSGWCLADYLRKKLSIHPLYSIILYSLPIGTSLLCRFAAKRGSMFTNSILTEGICTSLYLLFFFCILKYLWDNSTLHCILGWCIAFIMISSRKQMLMVLPLLFFSIVYHNYKKQKLWKNLLFAGFICFLTLPCFTLFDCTYNYFLRGIFEGHSSSNRFVSTMVFYNAELSDASYIEEEDIQQLFIKIYDVCDSKQYLASHAEQGWFSEVNHFGDHYDHIQIDTLWPMILEHARETINKQYPGVNEEELRTLYDKETDRLNSVIINSILPHQIPDLIKTLWNNFLSGLLITIAQLRKIFIPYAIVMFSVYFGLIGYLIYVISKTSSHTDTIYDSSSKTITFSLLTLVGIFSNVFLVSAVIFCQNRYTIYNMPLFYMAGAILLYQSIRIRKS